MTKESAFWRDAAVLLIDHQVGTMSWVKSIPVEEMKRNALMLAKTASIMKLPTVLTSSMEDHAQGPLMKELEEVLPEEFGSRIRRAGIVNAMNDENFAAAVKATGRKTLLVAGVAILGSALQALRMGGACAGSPSSRAFRLRHLLARAMERRRRRATEPSTLGSAKSTLSKRGVTRSKARFRLSHRHYAKDLSCPHGVGR